MKGLGRTVPASYWAQDPPLSGPVIPGLVIWDTWEPYGPILAPEAATDVLRCAGPTLPWAIENTFAHLQTYSTQRLDSWAHKQFDIDIFLNGRQKQMETGEIYICKCQNIQTK